jgi:hypothetical protein
MTPDVVNGLIEAIGGLFVLNHCRRLYIDKQVKGVSLVSTAFFFLWGLWNVFYYPSLNQRWSFAGGIIVVSANFLWIALMLHYRGRR